MLLFHRINLFHTLLMSSTSLFSRLKVCASVLLYMYIVQVLYLDYNMLYYILSGSNIL
jgi:hypothetical protein